MKAMPLPHKPAGSKTIASRRNDDIAVLQQILNEPGEPEKVEKAFQKSKRFTFRLVGTFRDFSTFRLSGHLSTFQDFATFRFSGHFPTFRDFSTFSLFVFLVTFQLFGTLQLFGIFRLFGTFRLSHFSIFRVFSTFRFFVFLITFRLFCDFSTFWSLFDFSGLFDFSHFFRHSPPVPAHSRSRSQHYTMVFEACKRPCMTQHDFLFAPIAQTLCRRTCIASLLQLSFALELTTTSLTSRTARNLQAPCP